VSYTVDVYIRCDDPGCPKLIRFREENRGGLNKTAASYGAVAQGWDISSADPKVAFCPRHARGDRPHRPSPADHSWVDEKVTTEFDGLTSTTTIWRAPCKTCGKTIVSRGGAWKHEKGVK
jgi:hypothetical protein